jgi:hypothetical protein
LTDPRAAAVHQASVVSKINNATDTFPDADLAYGAIAHVPLLFLAGFQLATKKRILLLENNRDKGTWDYLNGSKSGQELKLESAIEGSDLVGDVLLRISISFAIAANLAKQILPSSIASLHLKVPNPARDVVTSRELIDEYSKVFRNTLDVISSSIPHTAKVHVFYAGPASLAFNFGRQISRTTHPEIAVYNYTYRPQPRYAWAVTVTRDPLENDFLFTI